MGRLKGRVHKLEDQEWGKWPGLFLVIGGEDSLEYEQESKAQLVRGQGWCGAVDDYPGAFHVLRVSGLSIERKFGKVGQDGKS